MDTFVKRTPAQQHKNFLDKAKEIRVDKKKQGDSDTPPLLGHLENTVGLFQLVKEADNVKDEIQQLVFSDTLPKKAYKFVEVTKKMAEEFKQGQKLIFRGGHDDFAVLCTDDKTYDVKEVETSNSLHLIPELKDGSAATDNGEKYIVRREIVIMSHHYYELKEIECVCVFRLRDLLHETELMWNWITATSQGKMYSFSALLDQIRMSEQQLKDYLNTMPVIEHQGYLRWLSYDFRDHFIEDIISMADEDEKIEVAVENVSFEGLRKYLPVNATDEAIQWFLRNFCKQIENKNTMFKMLPRPIVRSRASYILRNVSEIDIPTFERHLDQMLPAGIELEYSYLEGIAIVTESFKGRTISYLNIEDLPEEPRERLRILFDRKNLWKFDEIVPFLTDICANTKAISSLLVNHCRSSTDENGDKVFVGLRPV